MKKVLLVVGIILMSFSLVSCNFDIKDLLPNEDDDELLLNVRSSLMQMYSIKEQYNATDYSRIRELEGCDIEWSVDVISGEPTDVVVSETPDGYKIDINENALYDITYILTATITTPNGYTGNVKYTYVIPKKYEEIKYDGVYDGSDVTITFYHTMGANLRDQLDWGIQKFNELYPNIKIQHEQVGGYDDVRNRISTELTDRKSPNIAYCYPDHVALYNTCNSVVTLDELINNKNIVNRNDGTTEIFGLTEEQKADFITGFYNEGMQFGDGLMYSMPFSKSTDVLYYNKTFFEECGLAVPTHWFSESVDDTTSMEYVCKRIKEIDPMCVPLGVDSTANWFITMCEQLGSEYTTPIGENKYLFNNDVNKSFCKEFRRWYQAGCLITQEIYGAYTSSLFKSQNSAKSYMAIVSSAGARHYVPDKIDGLYPFEVGIVPVPQCDPYNPKFICQGPSLCVFKKDNPQEVYASWLFIKFLTTNPEFQASFSMASGYIPVIKSVYFTPTYHEFLNSADGGDNIAALAAKVCMEQADAYFTPAAFMGSGTAREEVDKLLNKILAVSSDDVDYMIDKAFADAIKNCELYG